MKTIAICNHKGGVGKTAASMALAEGLNAKGYRTLLVDLDQQTNATRQAGAKIEDAVTVYDLLTSFEYTAADGIQHYEHGDIIPGDTLVADAEVEMSKLDTPLTMLADALEGVEGNYDYCVIDCPPQLGIVTRNAIVAADDVIVVVVPDTASVDGFGKVYQACEAIRKNKRLNPNVTIAGILINTYDARGRLERSLDEQLPEVAENADTKVFETRIRKCVSVRQAQSAHISLWDYDPECTAAEDFKAFIDEYLNQEEN